MNIFGDLNWLYLLQSLAYGIGIGAVVSICIRLNLMAQNKYRTNPSSFSNFLQSITYLGCVIVGLPAIFYLGVHATDLNDSLISTVSFIVGIISPIVIAFRSGFIPVKSNQIKNKKP